MNVSYVAPLRHAWARMQRMLFRPFRIEFWLTLGFAAFLSEGLSHPGGGGGGGRFGPRGRVPEGLPHAAHAVAAFLLHPVWGLVAICILALVAIVALLFIWIGSRGKFIFLDGVMRERAAIVEPWKRFRPLGNSLFRFWLGMAIVSVVTILTVSLPLIPALLSAAATGQGWPIVLAIVLSWWAAAMVPLLLLIAYTHLFLFQFVVPIMYREGIGVLAAWGKFLALFRSHVLHFLAFGLFFIVLLIGVAVAIMVVGFSTCCVGFVLFALPYVSSVVLLPIDVLFRGLGPDFLAQFGPEWSIGERTTTEPPR